ncbi:MAG TPA: SGNH/GDSL hydrolase family protein [Propionibacterium sp.]|nr:SGNH/GDSL hydrolase family protein [Propionibacterium sp.]
MIRFRAAAIAVTASLALIGAAAQPADAGPMTPNRGRYAALGDSYAAGVGNQPLKNAGVSLRSAAAYPVLLADQVNKVTFLAVSGATTGTVSAHQVPQIPRSVTQVTLTAGGNDVGFGMIAMACTSPDAATQCGPAVAAAQARLPQMTADLAALIQQVQDQAPRAEIYVTGYPILFQCGPHPVLGTVDAANQQLNHAIRAVALAQGATYVDVTDEFAGHGLCQGPNSWILPAGSVAPLHPTARGQQAYADAIEATAFTSAAES